MKLYSVSKIMKKAPKSDDDKHDKKEDKRNDKKDVDKKGDQKECGLSILKHPTQGNGAMQKQSPRGDNRGPPVPKRSIKWDELNVTATLHPIGKDYGHMKIEEPPTPYERSEEAINPEALAERLEKLERVRRAFSASSTNSESESGESLDQQQRRESFAKKRKEHYNEYKRAKESSRQYDADDEDEDFKK